MDNQHQKIKGYRDLSQAEIDLMNEVKAKGEEIRALMKKIEAVLGLAPKLAEDASITEEADAPHYWLRTADAYFRSASMAAVRAIAQPTSY